MADITSTGPVGLKGLKGLNQLPTDEESKVALLANILGKKQRTSKEVAEEYRPLPEENVGLKLANYGFGESSYDKNIVTSDEAQDLNNYRALNQPWALQLLNGAVKGQITAGTTLINGTLGTIWGLGQGIANALDSNPNTSFLQGFWDNDINKAMASIQNDMEKVLPNYYSNAQLNSPWYSAANVLSANFLGDKILKNMGFTEGAIAAALVPGFNMSWLAKGIGALGKAGSMAKNIGNFAGFVGRGLVAASSEATVEAINAVKDNITYQNNNIEIAKSNALKSLDENYQAMIANGASTEEATAWYGRHRNLINNEADKAKQQVNKQATDVGNSVYAMNLALLFVTNNLEFGRLLKGGFNSQAAIKGMKFLVNGAEESNPLKIAQGLLKGTTKVAGDEIDTSAKRIALGAVRNSLSEGFEEGAQRMISDTAQLVDQAKLNKWANKEHRKDKTSMFAASLNPDVSEEFTDYMKAAAKTWHDSFGSPEATGWEEVALGAITGMFGSLGMRQTKEGKLKVDWIGGIREAYEDAKAEQVEQQAAIERTNKALTDPKFIERSKRAIAAMTFSRDMNEALDRNDVNLFKNSELLSIANTALAMRGAGMGEIYENMLQEMAKNIDDDTLTEIKSQLTNMETGESYLQGKTDDELKSIYQKKAASNLSKVKEALSVYDNLNSKYGNTLNEISPLFKETAITEMTGAKLLIQDLNRRKEELNTQLSDNTLTEKEKQDITKGIEQIDNQIKEHSDKLNSWQKNPKSFIDELIDRQLFFEKVKRGKDDAKTVEAYIQAETLDDVAKLFYFNGNKVDVLNKAIDKAEGKTKELLKSFLPTAAVANGLQSVIQTIAHEENKSQGVDEEAITNLLGSVSDAALSSLFNSEEYKAVGVNTFKASFKDKLKDIREEILKGISNNANQDEKIAAVYQSFLVDRLLKEVDKITTAQQASSTVGSKGGTNTTNSNTTNSNTTDNNSSTTTKQESEKATSKEELFTEEKPKEGTTVSPKQDIEEREELPPIQEGDTIPIDNKHTHKKESIISPDEETKPTDKFTITGNDETTSTEEANTQTTENSNEEDSNEEDKEIKETNEKDKVRVIPKEGELLFKEEEEEAIPTKEEIEKAEGQVPTNEGPVIVRENKEPTPEVTSISYVGNAFLKYFQDALKRHGLLAERNHRTVKAFYKACEELGIDIQAMTDYHVGDLLNGLPNRSIPVKYMHINHGYLSKGIALVTPYTDEVAKICPDYKQTIKGNIVDVNGRKYLIVGYLGYAENQQNLGDKYGKLLKALIEERGDNKDTYFVSDKYANEIFDINSGSVIRRKENEPKDTPSSKDIRELVNDPTANPDGISLQDIKWGYISAGEDGMGQFNYVNFNIEDSLYSLSKAMGYGKVFIGIKGANGIYIPYYVEPLLYNDVILNESSEYYKKLRSVVESFIKGKGKDKLQALAILKDMLLFREGNNIFYDEKRGTVNYTVNNNRQPALINFNSPHFEVEGAIKRMFQMIERTNPHFNISFHTNVKGNLLEYYADAGLIKINARSLRTVNAKSFVRPIDDSFNPIINSVNSKDIHETPKATVDTSIVYLNGVRYAVGKNNITNASNNKVIDDKEVLDLLNFIQSIGVKKPDFIEDVGRDRNLSYWETGDKVIILSSGGYHVLTDEEVMKYKVKKAEATEKEVADKQDKEIEKALENTEVHSPESTEEKAVPTNKFTISGGEENVTTSEVEKVIPSTKFAITDDTSQDSNDNTATGINTTNSTTSTSVNLNNSDYNVTFEKAYKKFNAEQKKMLKEAIKEATGKQVKNVKEIGELLSKSPNMVGTLYRDFTDDDSIEDITKEIKNCGI
jgi:hypothetical protein